jgi:hypothetical protein
MTSFIRKPQARAHWQKTVPNTDKRSRLQKARLQTESIWSAHACGLR